MLGKDGPCGAATVAVLVLVIEKIELVKPVAKRIEDEDDILAR
jgi:hypothetical protein